MDTAGGTQPADAGCNFFISYTAADQAWAEWVAWHLEDAGYRVRLQAWDFVPGTHWTTQMMEDVARAEHTLAILSRPYLKSAYGRAEWEAAYRADPEGLRHKLIPVRVEDCELPGLLDGVVYFDLFDCPDAAATRQRLLDKIRVVLAGRAKPPAAPAFPGHAATSDAPPAGPPMLQPLRRAPRSAPPPFPRSICPTCHKDDRVQSVPAIVSGYTQAGSGEPGEKQVSSTFLAQLLQRPEQPKGKVRLYRCGCATVIISLIAVIVGIVVNKDFALIVALLAILAIYLLVFAGKIIDKQDKGKDDIEWRRKIWGRLSYCSRDNTVFIYTPRRGCVQDDASNIESIYSRLARGHSLYDQLIGDQRLFFE